MNNLQSDCGSISQLLEIFRQIKSNPTKQLSSLSFSVDSSYNSQNMHHRNPLGSISSFNSKQTKQSANFRQKKDISQSCNIHQNVSFGNNSSIFQKLYQEKKQLDQRKCRLQFESKRSKQQKEQQQCTFSPNIHLSRNINDQYRSKSRTKIKAEYDSVEQNESFYLKNVEWLERKDKSIKKLQCEKNQQNVNQLTFTPRINKKKTCTENKENQKSKITGNRGVDDFLERQKKAKAMQEYVKNKRSNPYSHVWNIKKGHFSYVK